MLKDFAPKGSRFDATLVGGRVVEVTLRPYTLADMAWSQQEFSSVEQANALSALMVEPMCRVIWHQMTPESRNIFFRIKFEAAQDEKTGDTKQAHPEGYERLLNGVADLQSILAGWQAMAQCMSVNGFIADSADSKKKTAKKTRMSGLKFMTWLRPHTG